MASVVLSGSGKNKSQKSAGPIVNHGDECIPPVYRNDYLELGELPPNFVSETYDSIHASVMQQRVSPLDMPSVITGEIRVINNSPSDFWIVFSNKERFLLKGSRFRSHQSTPHLCILRRMVQAPIYDHDYGMTENMGKYCALTPAQQQKETGAECPSSHAFSKLFISAFINRPVFVRQYGCIIIPTTVFGCDTYTYPTLEDEYKYKLDRAIQELRDNEYHPITIHVNDPAGILPSCIYAWINGYYSKIKVSRRHMHTNPKISITRVDDDGRVKLETFYIGHISEADIGRNVWAFDGILIGATKSAIQDVLEDDHAEDIIGPSNNRVVSLMSQVTDLTSTADAHLQRVKVLESELKAATDAIKNTEATRKYLAERDEDARRIKLEEDNAKHAREMERIRQETEHKDTLARIKAEEDARKAADEEIRRQFEREKMEYERDRMRQEREYKEAVARAKLEEDARKAADDALHRKFEREKLAHDAEHKARMEHIKIREAKIDRRFKIFETIVKSAIVIATTVVAILKFIPKGKVDSMA